jgi:hypothetical protein
MLHVGNSSLFLIFTVAVSIFGLLTLSLLALYGPVHQETVLWRKPVIGATFTIICLIGIVATLFPKKCSEAFNVQKLNQSAFSDVKRLSSRRSQMHVEGHHPDCHRFSAHVLHVGRRTICAACAGLFIGAVAAIATASFYFFGDWVIAPTNPLAMLVGQMGLVSGLVQFKFRGCIRLVANAFFVIGALLCLVAADALAGSLLVDIFAVALILFLILTRIMISRWDHWRICLECGFSCDTKKR